MAQIRLVIRQDVFRTLGYHNCIRRPERERIDRTAGPRPARTAVAIPHRIGLAVHPNFDGTAEARPCINRSLFLPHSLTTRRSVVRSHFGASKIAVTAPRRCTQPENLLRRQRSAAANYPSPTADLPHQAAIPDSPAGRPPEATGTNPGIGQSITPATAKADGNHGEGRRTQQRRQWRNPLTTPSSL